MWMVRRELLVASQLVLAPQGCLVVAVWMAFHYKILVIQPGKDAVTA